MNDLQLFEPLAPHIEDALRASIRRFGVLSPITRDQHGRILDGHHRQRIADEEGIGIADDVIIDVRDDDEAREIARTLNSDRRHLSEEQRRAVVADLRSAGHSYRAIAGALRVGKSTVADDIAQLSGAGQLEQPERVKSLDGRSRPATRPAPEPPAGEAPATSTAGAGEDAPSGATPEPEGSVRPPLPDGQDRADAAVADAEQELAEADARRDAELDAQMAGTVQRFRYNFARARRQAREITTFDADRAAEVFAGNYQREIGDLVRDLREWCDAIESAHRRRASGFRIVDGGAR